MAVAFAGVVGSAEDAGGIGGSSIVVPVTAAVAPATPNPGEGSLVIALVVVGPYISTFPGLGSITVTDDAVIAGPYGDPNDWPAADFSESFGTRVGFHGMSPSNETESDSYGISDGYIVGRMFSGLEIGDVVTFTFSHETQYRAVTLLAYTGSDAVGSVVGPGFTPMLMEVNAPLDTITANLFHNNGDQDGDSVGNLPFTIGEIVGVTEAIGLVAVGGIGTKKDGANVFVVPDPGHPILEADAFVDLSGNWTSLTNGGFPAQDVQVGDNIWGAFRATWPPSTSWITSTFKAPLSWATAYFTGGANNPFFPPDGLMCVLGLQPYDFPPIPPPFGYHIDEHVH